MNPVELQNAYFRSEGVHALTHLAAVHHELAQRHLAMRLEQEREGKLTQVREVDETGKGAPVENAVDQDGSRDSLPGRRYKILQKKEGRPMAVINDPLATGGLLDILA